MTKTLRIGLRLLTASLLTTTLGAAPILAATPKAPPKSDGSSGSFDAQFGNGEYLVAFDTDNGQVVQYIGGGNSVKFYVPTRPFSTMVSPYRRTFLSTSTIMRCAV